MAKGGWPAGDGVRKCSQTVYRSPNNPDPFELRSRSQMESFALSVGIAVPLILLGIAGPHREIRQSYDFHVLSEYSFCAGDLTPIEYYSFPLVSTGSIVGTGISEGIGEVDFAPSPFGLSVAANGNYIYNLHLTVTDLPKRVDGDYTVWITTPDIDKIRRFGRIGHDGSIHGQVAWNKFIVVVTLERRHANRAGNDNADRTSDLRPRSSDDSWSGPIIMRGMSRSGLMHGMAGHGVFGGLGCNNYGYQ